MTQKDANIAFLKKLEETGEYQDKQDLENQRRMLSQQGRYQAVAQYGQFNGGIQMRVRQVYHQPAYSAPTAFQGYRMGYQQPMQYYQAMPVRYQQVMYRPAQMQVNYRMGGNIAAYGYPGVARAGMMQVRMVKPTQVQYASNQAGKNKVTIWLNQPPNQKILIFKIIKTF